MLKCTLDCKIGFNILFLQLFHGQIFKTTFRLLPTSFFTALCLHIEQDNRTYLCNIVLYFTGLNYSILECSMCNLISIILPPALFWKPWNVCRKIKLVERILCWAVIVIGRWPFTYRIIHQEWLRFVAWLYLQVLWVAAAQHSSLSLALPSWNSSHLATWPNWLTFHIIILDSVWGLKLLE